METAQNWGFVKQGKLQQLEAECAFSRPFAKSKFLSLVIFFRFRLALCHFF